MSEHVGKAQSCSGLPGSSLYTMPLMVFFRVSIILAYALNACAGRGLVSSAPAGELLVCKEAHASAMHAWGRAPQ